MKKKRFKNQSGFSIVEVIIILTIIAILVTLAISQFGSSKTDFQRQRIAREFKVYLERARFDSVKRRANTVNDMSRIVLNSATSFTAAIDFNENGVIDTSEIRTIDFTHRSNTQIVVSDTFNYPVTIRFNQRGHVTATDGLNNAVTPVFTICSSNCAGANQESTIISLSTTGTVAVLKAGQSPSALPTPQISNVTPQFNCYVLINSNTATCLNK
jgi:type II secretory pathway pseudopilin PulG